ncbi:MAG: hypothetical protein II718_08410 [Clostridiales bacterium]|nr:hypothetical protein [Clostridiales bacterium]
MRIEKDTLFKRTLAAALLAALMLLSACSDQPGKIRETSLSPSGLYRIDEVDWSGGATAGESYLMIEYSDDGFAEVGDYEPSKAIKIEETLSAYRTDYHVFWDADDSFTVTWSGHDRAEWFEIARVEIKSGGYEISCGKVSVDLDGYYFSDFVIDGDNVYMTCSFSVVSTFDRDVSFIMEAADIDDAGGLLENGDLKALDDNGQAEVFVIGGGQTETIEVTFTGTKGPSDTKYDRNLPKWIYIDYCG